MAGVCPASMTSPAPAPQDAANRACISRGWMGSRRHLMNVRPSEAGTSAHTIGWLDRFSESTVDPVLRSIDSSVAPRCSRRSSARRAATTSA